MIPAALSASDVPSASVNDCWASVYTGTVSTVALNSRFKSPSLANNCASVNVVLPSLTNTFTFCIGLAAVLLVAPKIDIGLEASLLPVGSVAPVAAISIVPEPSEEMVAPPMSSVSADKNAVCHLRVELPNWNTPS